ncbi:general substrate transporter [Apodospora peruviana]|uniref:General substrate transporter n=1 Tax=Apodospora peruviana TaxID=516989 RepID=A0AAE0HX71_9PEZI|nr:general substrate transporter [Apodospora peruviana]
MEAEKVVPTGRELENFDLSNPTIVELIQHAEESDAADRKLTIRQALKKYKKAVFWAMFLSTSLIMEGYDIVMITSFYGQTQFKEQFGVVDPATGEKLITPAWQSGVSNSALVGQLAGLAVNAYAQDRFGARMTTMFFMAWMAVMIFIPVFATSLPIFAFGEAMCGVAWGVFQTLSTAYASEVVPTILRPYVTAYVCMCWGAGILLSSGVVRAVASIDGEMGWRLPFILQWIWPVPLFIGAYLAPESPWNAVRRNKIDLARQSLIRLHEDTPDREREVEATLAYIRHTTELENADTENASFLDCFRGTNLRRTEINCVVWAAQILCGNAILGYSVVFLQAAGFSELRAFDVNISLSACYIIGGIICWFLFPHLGRATIYMGGMTLMFFCLVAIGGLGWSTAESSQMAAGVLLVISTLINMITIGPVCYPIVAETPSGRLRYKTIVIGRFVYNLTGLVTNSITPRMLSPISWNWGAKAGLFYAGTNLLCNIWCWFRLPETKDRTFGEIDLLFENKVSARKFKYTKVDQFAHQNSLNSKLEVEARESVDPDEITTSTK